MIRYAEEKKLAIGVELVAQRYEIAVLNLYGETLHIRRYSQPFENSAAYYNQVCKDILSFIRQFNVPAEKVLGVGIVLQGLISADGTTVTYGKILNCTGLTTHIFASKLPFPVKFFHDGEAASTDELWHTPSADNMIYMNLRSNVSGAIIVNREFLQGTELKSGVFEHMTLVQDGKPCYCGRKGCMDTYCSTRVFLDADQTMERFFNRLRAGEQEERTIWRSYLQHLAISINNLHMFIDYTIVLGGTLAPFLQEEDLILLHWMVNNQSAFPTERRFIRISNCPNSPICRGAALSYIRAYFEKLIDSRR